MILIGSIAVPSNSPGIGNDVTIKMRIDGSIHCESPTRASERRRIVRRRVNHADWFAAMPLIPRQVPAMRRSRASIAASRIPRAVSR